MKKTLLVCIATLLFMIGIVSTSNSTPILDQESPYNYSAGFSVDFPGSNWQQEVVVGVGGLLTSVEIYRREVIYVGSDRLPILSFYINSGNGWQSDTHDIFLSDLLIPDAGWNLIDLSFANLMFDVGDTFVIGLGNADGHINLAGNFPGLYTPGQMYFNGSVDDMDLVFRTYMDPVPEAATMLLFGTGLAGLVGIRRRKKA